MKLIKLNVRSNYIELPAFILTITILSKQEMYMPIES